MAIYGLGCTYESGDVSKKFIEKGIACIGWDEKEKKYFQGMFREIENGDVIFLKTFDIKGRRLIIKAIGIVIDNEINGDNADEELGYCIKVVWLKYDVDGIHEIQLNGDGCTQRATTIYKECNKEHIQTISNIILKSINP